MFLENLKIVEFPESQPFGNWQQKMVKKIRVFMYLSRLASLPEIMVRPFSFATGFPEIKTEYFV